MFDTIQQTKHKTRTFFGNSSGRYGRIEAPFKFLLQGVGQGNGAGPPIWAAVISSAMLEVKKKRGLSSTVIALISQQQLQLCGFTYVDNTDIIATDDTQDFLPNSDESV